MSSDKGGLGAFMQHLAGDNDDHPSTEGNRTSHKLFDERAHEEEGIRMQDLEDRSVEEPDASDPKVAAAVEKFNELVALLKH